MLNMLYTQPDNVISIRENGSDDLAKPLTLTVWDTVKGDKFTAEVSHAQAGAVMALAISGGDGLLPQVEQALYDVVGDLFEGVDPDIRPIP